MKQGRFSDLGVDKPRKKTRREVFLNQMSLVVPWARFMNLRNLSPVTQRSYLHVVTKFSRYCGRSPHRLGLEDVRTFQVYLVSQGISWPALNQTVCALRLFYGVTLDRGEIPVLR